MMELVNAFQTWDISFVCIYFK